MAVAVSVVLVVVICLVAVVVVIILVVVVVVEGVNKIRQHFKTYHIEIVTTAVREQVRHWCDDGIRTRQT